MKAEWTNNDSLTTSQTTKAILVIDMPKDCGHCQLSDFVDGDNCLCIGTDRKNNATEIPKWCPLKPMPMKMRTDGDDIEEDSYWDGWNECIDEILGEQNGDI